MTAGDYGEPRVPICVTEFGYASGQSVSSGGPALSEGTEAQPPAGAERSCSPSSHAAMRSARGLHRPSTRSGRDSGAVSSRVFATVDLGLQDSRCSRDFSVASAQPLTPSATSGDEAPAFPNQHSTGNMSGGCTPHGLTEFRDLAVAQHVYQQRAWTSGLPDDRDPGVLNAGVVLGSHKPHWARTRKGRGQVAFKGSLP
jgi:hypothetical protein